MNVTILNILPPRTPSEDPTVKNVLAMLTKVAQSVNGKIDSYEYAIGCFSLEVDREETSDVIKKFVLLMDLVRDHLFPPTV